MSEVANKYLDSAGVKHLWDKANEIYLKKETGKGLSEENYTAEEKAKLAELENYELPAATAESLGGIKIGDGLAVDENGVVHTVHNPEMPVGWDDIQDLPTTLEGYGITDAATKAELEAVRTSVSKVYKYCGKVATVADLNNIQNPETGDVYDVEEDGTNYAWNGEEERWDNLGSIVKIEALSNYELDLITGSASTEEALKELLVGGGNIDLGGDVSLSMAINVSKDTVLNLCGNTLTYSGTGYGLVANGAKLTIKNGSIVADKRVAQAENGGEVIVDGGTYRSGDVGFSAIGAGSKVTINGGSISAQEGGVGSFDGAAVEINGGTISGIDNFPVFTNGTPGRGGNTITFNKGELIGNITSNGYESCGVYIANNDTFVMNGGTIKSNDGCGILMRGGNVTINGGEIIAEKKTHVPGWVGDNKTKMSASAVIYHESANYPGKAGMSLTITGGKFVGADHSLEVLSNEATPNVTVTGGEFAPAYQA